MERVHCFAVVKFLQYLDVILTQDSAEEVEIDKRLTKRSNVYRMFSKFLKSKAISRVAKVIIHNTDTRRTLLYVSELWVMTKASENKVEIVEIWKRKI